MSGAEDHPTPEQLEAAAFGWLADQDAAAIRTHAARCPICGPLLTADEEVRQRLLVLRAWEPRVDVVQDVLRRLTDTRLPPRHVPASRRLAAALALALGIGLVGLLLVAPEMLQAATGWLKSTIVREVPPPGQPGALPTRVGTPSSGGPLRQVTLEEARRLVAFPVALPQAMPQGFTLAEVTIFQARAGTPPSQVFVTYRRPAAAQPLVLTYQRPDTDLEVTSPAGATRVLVVAGHRAVYIDAAAEGALPATGDGPPLRLGRLIVERPNVVLVASGDRGDGLDVDTLVMILASVP